MHEIEFGKKCRVVDCQNDKIAPTQACGEHADLWRKNVQRRSQSTVSGVRRILRRPGEHHAWQRSPQSAIQRPHDGDAPDDIQRKTYFSPNRAYCVETICLPCGVVLAWTIFYKAESPTCILEFLDDIFPDELSRPDYICINKACQVLRTAVSNHSWNKWKKNNLFYS